MLKVMIVLKFEQALLAYKQVIICFDVRWPWLYP